MFLSVTIMGEIRWVKAPFDVREYQCELIRVLDGDTIDCYIDLGFNLKVKKIHGY